MILQLHYVSKYCVPLRFEGAIRFSDFLKQVHDQESTLKKVGFGIMISVGYHWGSQDSLEYNSNLPMPRFSDT